ncbi:MAG: DUF1684 domain-containing protein [Anaerolineae bacterium]|nr:DUF1684 domain-containing protein [Anaerolineae bacterium]
MSQLDTFRKSKDSFFKNSSDSPLTDAQKRDFKGLFYFPENPQLHFEINIEELPEKQEIKMQTSSGDVQRYRRFGLLHFTVDGQAAVLTVYASEDGFFLPFADGLAGTETYGAGRYLEPQQLKNGKFLLDFNLAYNPYCAYNDLWSCPLTPAENHLKIPIRAGEKIFENHI